MSIRMDKKALIAACIAVPLILCAVMLNISLSSERELGDLKARQKELAVLKENFLALRSRVSAVESKKSLTQVKGIVQAADEIFVPLGLKQKVKSVKPIASKEMKDAFEEEAEVQIEKADINDAVNILYRIENAPMALSVKRALLKTSFENPSSLNITMTIALIRPK